MGDYYITFDRKLVSEEEYDDICLSLATDPNYYITELIYGDHPGVDVLGKDGFLMRFNGKLIDPKKTRLAIISI